MKLSSIFNGADDREVINLATDSRNVRMGSIFFCIEGFSADRHDFVGNAIDAGAIAIVHSKPIEKITGIFYVQVENVAVELERVVAVFFDNPAQKLTVYGVTGTNGKSTTTSTLRHVLNRLGTNTGYIGTISIEYNDVIKQPSLTTPDIIEMNEILREMVDAGVQAVALEVSSQGLDLGRVDTIPFDTVAFTNLSFEHMDYHKTMEQYYHAKKHLFDILSADGKIITNIDDQYGQRLMKEGYKQPFYTVGIENSAHYQALNIKLGAEKTQFTLLHEGVEYLVKTNLLAIFNIYNILEVIAMLHVNGYDLNRIIEMLDSLPIVKGRVNLIEEGQNFKAVVDYSHTPDGFENIYLYLNSITNDGRRLITVYGNAGGRDHAKRPLMAEISNRYCDLIILTEQDKRNEKVAEIWTEMAKGLGDTPHVFIENRYDAITYALENAGEGDTVVVLGKGDEKFLYGPSGREPWIGDDNAVREILKKIVEERK